MTPRPTTYDPADAATAAPDGTTMDRKQKTLTSLLWGTLIVAMVGVVGVGLLARWRKAGPPVGLVAIEQGWADFPAPPFELTDQEGRTVTSEQLKGKPYVAAFIFTNCATGCSMMTQKMADLQQAVADPSVKLVSFTVDPARDTPEVLKRYAKNAGADAARWHFLTGNPEQLAAVAGGMRMAAAKAPDGSDQFIHSDRFILIDAAGQVRRTYRNSDADAMGKLAIDAERLAKDGTL